MSVQPQGSLAAEAYQGYLRGLRTVWKDDCYAAVVEAAGCKGVAQPAALEEAVADEWPYRLYGWLERHLQQFKYFGRWGLAEVAAPQMPTLSVALNEAAARHPERLQLDPAVAMPAYYTEADFHQHRGGVWSEDLAAFVYEWAADRYSFALADSTRPYTIFAQRVLERGPFADILDIGCGFGKSTLPFKRLAPGARVTGLDLSRPCLRLAHLRALEEGLDVAWRQGAAEALPYADASIDVMACYWLFHELPAPVQARAVQEAFRALRPGGLFASRDMHTTPGGVVGEMLHLGHAIRNQEPFLPDLRLRELTATLLTAGFGGIEVLPADGNGAPLLEDAPLASSRTHVNTILIARKPAA